MLKFGEKQKPKPQRELELKCSNELSFNSNIKRSQISQPNLQESEFNFDKNRLNNQAMHIRGLDDDA